MKDFWTLLNQLIKLMIEEFPFHKDIDTWDTFWNGETKIDSKEANEVRHHILSIRYACQFGEHMCKTHATLIKFNVPKMAILMHNRGVRTL